MKGEYFLRKLPGEGFRNGGGAGVTVASGDTVDDPFAGQQTFEKRRAALNALLEFAVAEPAVGLPARKLADLFQGHRGAIEGNGWGGRLSHGQRVS